MQTFDNIYVFTKQLPVCDQICTYSDVTIKQTAVIDY